MRVRPNVVVLAVAMAVTAGSQETQFLSSKIMETPGFMGSAFFRDDGSLLCAIQDAISNTQDVYWNGVNLSASLLGANRYALAAGYFNGTPVWWGYGQLTGGDNKSRVYVGGTDVSSIWVPGLEWARAAAASSAGVAWYGKRPGTNVPQDTYKDGQLLSGFLGSSRNTMPVDINESGQVLWHGFGSLTGGNRDVYIDTSNYTAGILTGLRIATAVAINNRGTVAWYGRGTNTNNKEHAFKNNVNVSAPLVGPDTVARSVLLNENDQLAWVAYLTSGQGISDVWLDQRNVSAAILGLDREAWPVALNDRGDLLWFGSGRNLDAVQDVFLNEVNLSQRVLGPGRPASHAVAINNRGWVLWQTPNALRTIDTAVSMPCRETVSGKLHLRQYTGTISNLPVTVRVRESNRGWNMGQISLSPDAVGSFSTYLPSGAFDLTFHAPTFLRRTVPGVDTTDHSLEALQVVLLGGDSDNDNDVDFTDLARVMYYFGTRGLDLTGDGKMDIADLNLVMTNFGLRGD